MSSGKKKEKPMSKMDFDFEDISGDRHVVDTEKPKHSLDKVIPETNKKSENNNITGIILTIRQNGNNYIKDLGECSGREFLAWATTVYPFCHGLKEETFDSLGVRRRAYQDILDFHRINIFNGNNEFENIKH